MAEVITMGEPMVVWIPQEVGDFTSVGSFSKGIAGAELNVAVGIVRLQHSVSYLSRVGEDVFGEYIAHEMRKEGIDTSSILVDPDHLTGAYFKTKVLSGDPSVHYLRKNSAASCMSPEDVANTDFSGARILHLTGIAAAVSDSCMNACQAAVKKARAHQMLVTFDPNIRPALWKSEACMIRSLNELACCCDMVMPGIKEGKQLTGREDAEGIADFYLEQGVQCVIVKTGAKGAYLKCAGKAGISVEGFKVSEIVDTVGAGDAFAAGVITGILEDLPLEEAVRRGNAMGAIMITSAGDNDAMPTREVLQHFMKEGAQ